MCQHDSARRTAGGAAAPWRARQGPASCGGRFWREGPLASPQGRHREDPWKVNWNPLACLPPPRRASDRLDSDGPAVPAVTSQVPRGPAACADVWLSFPTVSPFQRTSEDRGHFPVARRPGHGGTHGPCTRHSVVVLIRCSDRLVSTVPPQTAAPKPRGAVCTCPAQPRRTPAL